MEFQNKSSNVTKDNDAKEIELLTMDLEFTEDARAAIISSQDNCDPMVHTQDDSDLTVSAQDDSDLTVSAQDDSDLTVSAQDDSDLTVSAQDDSIEIMTVKKDFYQLMTHLQKIAEESKDSSFKKMYAGLLREPMTANLTGKEIYDLLIFALLNLVERNLKINVDLMRNFKELFGEMVSVLQYVISAGTGHLSFENKKIVHMHLDHLRLEIRYRIDWLNKVQADFESFLQFSNQIGIPVHFPHINKSARVITEKLKAFIIAIKLFLPELKKYDGNASTIIECLRIELSTKDKLFH